jgi:hypothetical protein
MPHIMSRRAKAYVPARRPGLLLAGTSRTIPCPAMSTAQMSNSLIYLPFVSSLSDVARHGRPPAAARAGRPWPDARPGTEAGLAAGAGAAATGWPLACAEPAPWSLPRAASILNDATSDNSACGGRPQAGAASWRARAAGAAGWAATKVCCYNASPCNLSRRRHQCCWCLAQVCGAAAGCKLAAGLRAAGPWPSLLLGGKS